MSYKDRKKDRQQITEPIASIGEDKFSAPYSNIDFGSIKIGAKSLEDATYVKGDLTKSSTRLCSKDVIFKAIDNLDYLNMRDISKIFYRKSGIYRRLCRYLAYMYRYDWFVTPYIVSQKVANDKVITDFNRVLTFLDNSNLKQFFGETALKVVTNGVYYGYRVENKNRLIVQELDSKYCRSRFTTAEGNPAVEFNMQYFDDVFSDTTQKMRILNLFPKEFAKGYSLYKKGKLKPDFMGDSSGWYLLDPTYTIRFTMNGEEYPTLLSVIPSIIDLDDAQALDRKKMQQQILKILIQKMPIDKNGDLVFDVQEAQVLHNNAVQMLGKAIGIDVLTTFADVSVEDMMDSKTSTTTDELEKVERGVYNEAGISQLQFNTDGNIALEKSILNDEATMYNLIQQFESFLNYIIKPFNPNPKKMYFKVQILGTTIYNYKDLSKMYKEQTQIGYSKILPQIALGQSQSSILANAHFENNVLDLVNVFIPPLSSNTMSASESKAITEKNSNANTNTEESKGGRPEKEDDQKSEKTIANKESAG